MAHDTIISLDAERDKRHGPDAQFVYVDGLGVRWFKFGAEYADGDKTYGFDLWATSHEDADRRLGLIKSGALIVGQIHSEIPA